MNAARVLLLLLALPLLACRKESAAASTPEKPAPVEAGSAPLITIEPELLRTGRVKVGLVERRLPQGEWRLAGEIAPDEAGQADVGTLVSGRVASLEAKEGMRVARGQLLAWVEAPDVARAPADVLRARARAAVALRKLERQLALEAQDATSKNAIDEARAEDHMARADLAAARTLLVNLGGQEPRSDSPHALAARVAVRSPIAGIVSERFVVLGAPVSPDRSLFRIIASDRIMVLARWPETFGPIPSAGATAEIKPRTLAVESTSDRCTATVFGHYGVVSDVTRSRTLRLAPVAMDAGASCGWLVPGGYVDVVFVRAVSEPRALNAEAAPVAQLVLPKQAVVEIKGVPAVFVPTGTSGQFQVRAVRVHAEPSGDLVAEAGLAEGETIVTSGALLLKGELLRAELASE